MHYPDKSGFTFFRLFDKDIKPDKETNHQRYSANPGKDNNVHKHGILSKLSRKTATTVVELIVMLIDTSQQTRVCRVRSLQVTP